MAATGGESVHNRIQAFNVLDSQEKRGAEVMTVQDPAYASDSNNKNNQTDEKNIPPIDYTATANPNAVEKSKIRLEQKFSADESKSFLSETTGDKEKTYVDSTSPISGEPICCGVQCTSQMR